MQEPNTGSVILEQDHTKTLDSRAHTKTQHHTNSLVCKSLLTNVLPFSTVKIFYYLSFTSKYKTNHSVAGPQISLLQSFPQPCQSQYLGRLLSVTDCGKQDSTLLTQIPYSGQYSLIQSSSTHFNIIMSQASLPVPRLSGKAVVRLTEAKSSTHSTSANTHYNIPRCTVCSDECNRN